MGIPIAALSPALRAKLNLPGSVKSKYGARKKEVDGITFDSAKEARHFLELQMRERAGEIENLQCQPVYFLFVDGEIIGQYRADFRYRDRQLRAWVVVDVKGMDTPLSAWKRKHVSAQYGIDVVIR